MKLSVVNVSTWYPEAIEQAQLGCDHMPYAEMLRRFEDFCFGSDAFWSWGLRALGHEVRHVVANAERLQAKWRAEEMACRPASPSETVMAQAKAANADAVLLQDVSFMPAGDLRRLHERGCVVAAQVSCPMPPPNRLAQVDVAFTSFPHYVERLRAHGVARVEFLPLAFEPSVVKRAFPIVPLPARTIDVSFVGGVGRDSHWRAGTDAVEAVARVLGPDRFAWHGYGLDRLSPDSPLRACHRGGAWGLAMYEVYLRSKIVLNRHGEVSEGCGNNLRQFESTGAGACLLTDECGAFRSGVSCVRYRTPDDAAERAFRLLLDPQEILRIAGNGQAETWESHTWRNRMETVAPILEEEVSKRGAALGGKG